MKLRDAAIILGVLAAFFLCGYIFGRCSANRSDTVPARPEAGVLTADDLRPVEVNEPEEILFVDPEPTKTVTATPKSVTKTNKIVQEPAKTVSNTPTVRPIQPGDDSLKLALVTVRDWNLERIYSGTLFDNKQSGTLNYSASVQRNTLTRLEYDYQPLPVIVKRNRVRPYLRGHVDTRRTYGASAGALYKWFGADAGLVRYGQEQYAVSLGVMIVF